MQIESILTRFFLENISEGGDKQTIIDNTETNMVALRRTIYLTIQSSLDFEECAHKLMKMELKPGQEVGKNDKTVYSLFNSFKPGVPFMGHMQTE